jgi:hypothetical protein
LSRKYYASKESRIVSEVYYVRNQRRIYESSSLQGDLRKIRPPTFDGESKGEDDDES